MSILHDSFLNICANVRQAMPGQPCLLCGALSHNGPWCAACDRELPYLAGPHCPICALPTPNGDTCGHCVKKQPAFDRTLAVFAYAFPLNKLVQALKYGEHLALANALAARLTPLIEARPDFIIPMPLHPARLRERGFNQSLELARYVASHLKIPLQPHACKRVRDTPPQSTLAWKDRKKNMRKAFTCTQDLAGKHVALMDDVMTSGASLNEAAQTLRRAGASEVSAWVIARTLPHAGR